MYTKNVLEYTENTFRAQIENLLLWRFSIKIRASILLVSSVKFVFSLHFASQEVRVSYRFSFGYHYQMYETAWNRPTKKTFQHIYLGTTRWRFNRILSGIWLKSLIFEIVNKLFLLKATRRFIQNLEC